MQELLTVCKNCLQYARIAYSMQELLTVCKNCLQYARIAYSMQELLTVCKYCLQYARIAYSIQELLTVCKNFSLNCKTGGVEGLGMRLTAVSIHEDVYYIMELSYCRRSHMSVSLDELMTMTQDTCPSAIADTQQDCMLRI